MPEKEIHIELDKQTNPWKWVALILIGLLVVDVSCFFGLLVGGAAGYLLGHRDTSPHSMRYEYDYPLMPEIPFDFEPFPTPEPRFESPLIPESGERPRLGVTFVMTDEGAEIQVILPESPAEEAGLRVGDIITKVDGHEVTRTWPLDEVIMLYQPGDIVSLTVSRNGNTRRINVRLGAQP